MTAYRRISCGLGCPRAVDPRRAGIKFMCNDGPKFELRDVL